MPHRFSFASTFVNRSIIGAVYLAVLLIFFAAQMLFTTFLPLPPLSVFLLVAFASSLRLIEIFYAEQIVARDKSRSQRFAVSSIAWTLVLALLLAVLTAPAGYALLRNADSAGPGNGNLLLVYDNVTHFCSSICRLPFLG